tara:strand:+ start:416 stop:1606 length:1191 start_codon:yes stop_codon:yes gene_type:complete
MGKGKNEAHVQINDYPYTATVRDLKTFAKHLDSESEKFTLGVFGKITYISDDADKEWVDELNSLIKAKQDELDTQNYKKVKKETKRVYPRITKESDADDIGFKEYKDQYTVGEGSIGIIKETDEDGNEINEYYILDTRNGNEITDLDTLTAARKELRNYLNKCKVFITSEKKYYGDSYAEGGEIGKAIGGIENVDDIFVEGKYPNGDEFSENQYTNDADYVVNDWLKNSRGLESYTIFARMNDGEEIEIQEFRNGGYYAEGGVVNDTWMVEGNIIYVWDEKDLKYSEEEETYSQKYKRFYPISKFKTYQEVIDHEVDEFKKSNSDKVYKEEDLYLTKIHKKSHDDYNDRLRDKEEREWVEEQEKYNPKRSIGSYMADGGSVKKNGYFTGELSFLNW